MQISDEDLKDFMVLYEWEFRKPLPREKALEMATRLVTLYRVIMKPLPPEVESEIRRRSEVRLRCETSLQDV